jgi:pyruvate carboxylase
MMDSILKGKLKPMVGRPGDTLEPEDFAKVKKEMEEEFKKPITECDVQAFIMYPAVYRGYQKHMEKYGPLATYLPTPAFFYGLEVGEKIEFMVPGESLEDAEAKKDGSLPKTSVQIELTRVGPCEFDDMRSIEWLVNGKTKYVTKVKDPSSGKVAYAGPMAKAGEKTHLASPLPGVVTQVTCAEGDSVKKDAKLFTVAAMKMEVEVRAPCDCTVAEICIAKEQEVVDGALLAKIKF